MLSFERLEPAEMVARARAYADAMQRRRTVREFSPEPFPIEALGEAIRAAASAPAIDQLDHSRSLTNRRAIGACSSRG
ncbi:MAG: hypothetical protein ABIY55_16135 [Kofleriaceae bacterium]